MPNGSGANSIKKLIQSINPISNELILAKVININPLQVKGVSDEKLFITEQSLYVPRHLTDYKTKISFDNSSVLQSFETESRIGLDTGEAKEPIRSRLGFTSNIKHDITIYNALKVGDLVHLLALSKGKQYFILDRINE